MPHLLHEAAKANAKDLIEALIKEGTALDDYDEVRLEMRKRERESVCVCVCPLSVFLLLFFFLFFFLFSFFFTFFYFLSFFFFFSYFFPFSSPLHPSSSPPPSLRSSPTYPPNFFSFPQTGQTALGVAAENGAKDAAETLVRAGADVNKAMSVCGKRERESVCV